MRLVLRALVFATGFLIGGEALRRWLENRQDEIPAEAARHLRSVPSPPPPSPTPSPAAPTTTATPDPAAPTPKASRGKKATSKAELYKRAKSLGVKGRSKMGKADLADAVERAEARRGKEP